MTIAAGQKVLLDVDVPKLTSLTVNGALYFQDRPTVLRVGHIAVYGLLQLGTDMAPLQNPIDIVLDGQPTDDLVIDEVKTGANVLAVAHGGRVEVHGREVGTAWTRLATTAPAGSMTLTLLDPVQWRPCDRIVLASTSLEPLEFDESTISKISPDGKTVTLMDPLEHAHAAVTEVLTSNGETRSLEMRAEVGLLSRNIRLRGPDDASNTQFGGHTIVLAGSVMRISGAELFNMGQAGILGKYPLHWHKTGDARDSEVRDVSIVSSFNRMLTIHHTHNLTATNIVGHDTFGHAIMLEDGVETGNTLVGNLVMTVRRAPDGKRILSPSQNGQPRIGPGTGKSDDTPAAFWITNPTNTVNDNAATGVEGVGFWYDFKGEPGSEGDNLNATEASVAPLTSFDRNVTHSNRDKPGDQRFTPANGIFFNGYLGDYTSPPPVIRDNASWKNAGAAIWTEGNIIDVGSKAADSAQGLIVRYGASEGATVWGYTANTNGETQHFTSLVRNFYSHYDLADAWLANFDYKYPGAPGHLVAIHDENSTFGTPRIKNIHFFGPGNRVFLAPGYRALFFEDLDGSVLEDGIPAMFTNHHPMFADAADQDCAYRLSHYGRDPAVACAYGPVRKLLYVSTDSGGNSDEWTIVRDRDGSSIVAEHFGDFVGVMGERYHYVHKSGAAPHHVQLQFRGTTPGFMELYFDWPYPTASVQEGGVVLPEAGTLADLSNGMTWFHDKANQRLYIRYTLTGAERPFASGVGALDPDDFSASIYDISE